MTTTTMIDSRLSSYTPFSLFSKDSKQYSLHHLSEDDKTFLWHQFMLDVLLDIPRSLTAKKDIITACSQLANENDVNDGIELKQTDIDDFQTNYTSDSAVNCDAIISFHSIIKDLNDQLKQLHVQQKKNGKLVLPLTVYRGQTKWGVDEVKKIRANVGGFISMNTFLSTTTDSIVVPAYASGTDKDTSVLFQITVNDTKNDKRLQTFAYIGEKSNMKDENEVLFGASYVMTQEKELASKAFADALKSIEPQMAQFTPSWFAALTASSHITLHGADQRENQTLHELEPLMNKEQSDNDVPEKLRLLHMGHICSEQQKFVEALNHWEEAVEITAYLPSSLGDILNGAIYLQMAAAYFRLNNKSEALNAMKIAKQRLKSYYPSSHRMFASFNFLYGYYLMQNEKSSAAIECFEKSLENSYFSTNKDFRVTIYTLLAISYIQSNNLDRAEECCRQALEYQSPASISTQAADLLAEIPQLKIIVKYQNSDYGRQFVRASFRFANKLMSIISPKSSIFPASLDEQTSTYDDLIAFADHYRHRQDYTRAETYYSKALEKMTEIDFKSMWNVYRKIVRMKDDDDDRYRYHFIKQYSKYDDNNPKHFQIIATLQIIMCLHANQTFISSNQYRFQVFFQFTGSVRPSRSNY
ncbi:unnamed protein product [Rotaria sp. Silwood1]|nr:unnamed protein product [Rotaria sp. Silwood1]